MKPKRTGAVGGGATLVVWLAGGGGEGMSRRASVVRARVKPAPCARKRVAASAWPRFSSKASGRCAEAAAAWADCEEEAGHLAGGVVRAEWPRPGSRAATM